MVISMLNATRTVRISLKCDVYIRGPEKLPLTMELNFVQNQEFSEKVDLGISRGRLTGP